MALINRQTLKNYFKKGGFATEKHFEDLIDSSINAVDDAINVDEQNGLKLSATNKRSRVLSFFKKSDQQIPDFQIDVNKNNSDKLTISSAESDAIITLSKNGHIGINKEKPTVDLDVNGTIAIKNQVGTFVKNSAFADGSWQDIINNLDGISSFEINAKAEGKVGQGYYSVCHAIALSTFGGKFSKNSIKMTEAHYENFRNKIQLRWLGDMHNYALQIRTRRHYGIDEQTGDPYLIKFNLIDLSFD
jgi:hypothetical protein